MPPFSIRPRKKILRSESPPEASDPRAWGVRPAQKDVASHGHETESGRVPLASNRGAVTFDSDPAGNQRQTDGAPNWPYGPSIYGTECHSWRLPAGQSYPRHCPPAQSGYVAASLLALTMASIERTLAIRCDVRIVCGDRDRGCRRRLLVPAPAVKRHQPRTKPFCVVVVFRPAASIPARSRPAQLERASRRCRARRALRGRARSSA